MIITQDMKMADLVHLNHHLLPILDRFGIKLGFHDKTVNDICESYNIHCIFFLDILNAFQDEEYYAKTRSDHFPLGLLTHYLENTHQAYIQQNIPQIEKLVHQLVNENYQDTRGAGMLKNFFKNYREELVGHTRHEDEVVFPYALAIEKAYQQQVLDKKARGLMGQYSMEQYLNEHDDLEEKLFDLKNIILKYLPPPGDNSLSIQLLHDLFELEKDLNDHARIEEQIMVPRVQAMEKHLRETLF